MEIKLSVIKYPFFKKVFYFLLLFVFFVTNVSCQDNQHQVNEQWLQHQKQVASSTVLLNNKQSFVPIKDLEQKIASVNIGTANALVFDSLLNKYTTVTSFSISPTDSAFNNLSIDLKFYNTVIVEVAGAALNEKRTFSFLYDIQRSKHLVLVIYGTADALSLCDSIHQPVIVTPRDSPGSADFIAQLIFGGVPAIAKLGKTWSKHYHKNDGFVTAGTRLHYTLPEDAGINISDIEHPVDSLIAEAIQGKAIPGAVVMVVKDGKVIFDKAYGTHTYEGTQADKISDIFDMASVTKVSASTMAIMRLYEQKKIALDSPFGYYFPPARNTNKSNIKIRDLLLHQSGIASGVVLPLLPRDFSADSSESFPIKAGNNVFIRKNYYKDVILPRMLDVKVDTPKYVYSDLGMTYMKEVIENQSGTTLDEYLSKNFYFQLGMQSAGFNPLYRFDSARIVPTERDADFRKGLIHGYVHDPMAAKYGGVSGNAGLFASANDLAILYQMILKRGTYGGTKYFSPETINLFTSKQSLISRRGLGFDRVDTSSELSYPAKLASFQTYGHTGFTGTCFWVDPKYNLVFIFLSNRVYPKVNDTIYKLRTQENVLNAILKAIIKSSGDTPGKE
jgi:CubicO group peptidase (beta-lactamase class C family)